MNKLLLLLIIPLLIFGQNENDTIYSLNQKIELENEINTIKERLYLFQRQKTTAITAQILGSVVMIYGLSAGNNSIYSVGGAISLVATISSYNAYGWLNLDGHLKKRNKTKKNKNDGFTPFLKRKGIIKN